MKNNVLVPIYSLYAEDRDVFFKLYLKFYTEF